MSRDAVSGDDLRGEREAAEIKAYEIALHMRVHASRISQIEALAKVTPLAARRYRAALILASSPLANTTSRDGRSAA